MSAGFIATLVIACVLFVVFMVLRLTVATKSEAGGVAAMFAKAAASLGFIAIAIAGLYEGADNFRAALFVLAGLVFGLIGDIVLDLKVVYLERPEEGVYLTGGMVSFGAGHVMFPTAACLFRGGYITGALVGGGGGGGVVEGRAGGGGLPPLGAEFGVKVGVVPEAKGHFFAFGHGVLPFCVALQNK